MLVQANSSLLLVIDVQTKLAPAVDEAETCISRCHLLLTAARKLAVPVVATEHCPRSVGPTVPLLAEYLAAGDIVEKRHFDGMSEHSLRNVLATLGRRTVVVAGMEAHVCVLQTVFGLKEAGFAPVVVADAVTSRLPSSRDLALDRLRHQGIEIVNTEMVLFEWMAVAGTDAFNELLPMIKSGSVNG